MHFPANHDVRFLANHELIHRSGGRYKVTIKSLHSNSVRRNSFFPIRDRVIATLWIATLRWRYIGLTRVDAHLKDGSPLDGMAVRVVIGREKRRVSRERGTV
jgi:hypothetical protein